MKVTRSWLREFAPDIDGDPTELGEILSSLGLAVEEMEVVGEVVAIFDLIGVFGGEEAIVQAYLGIEGVGSGDPVNGALDLSTIGGISTS